MRVMILGNVVGGPARIMVMELDETRNPEAVLEAVGRMHGFDMSYGLVAIPVVAAVGGPLGKGPQ